MMTNSFMRNLVRTAVITASTWAAMPALAETPVPPAGAGTEDPGDTDAHQIEHGNSPSAVLGRLHLANIRETMLGKRAEKNGQSKEVRELGSLLVRDHSAADKKLLAFAKRQKIDVSVTGQTLEEPDLNGDTSFDEKFAEAMVVEHDKSIAGLKKAREESTDDALNSFLDSLLPMLEHHRDAAQQIVDKHKSR